MKLADITKNNLFSKFLTLQLQTQHVSEQGGLQQLVRDLLVAEIQAGTEISSSVLSVALQSLFCKHLPLVDY